jgi:hypothetical protein
MLLSAVVLPRETPVSRCHVSGLDSAGSYLGAVAALAELLGE